MNVPGGCMCGKHVEGVCCGKFACCAFGVFCGDAGGTNEGVAAFCGIKGVESVEMGDCACGMIGDGVGYGKNGDCGTIFGTGVAWMKPFGCGMFGVGTCCANNGGTKYGAADREDTRGIYCCARMWSLCGEIFNIGTDCGGHLVRLVALIYC